MAARSKAKPAKPVTNRRQCHRHHALRSTIQLEGKESLVQVITMALIGILRNRVIRPEAARKAAVAISNQKRVLSARESTAAVMVTRIVVTPRMGNAVKDLGGCVLYAKHGWLCIEPCYDYKTQPPDTCISRQKILNGVALWGRTT